MKSQVYITTYGDGTAQVILEGEDISQRVQSFSLNTVRGYAPILTLDYICYEQATIEGEMDVVHVCPKKAR